MHRRRFLSTLLAGAAAPALTWADAGAPDYLAAARDPAGDYALYGLREDGTRVFRVVLPGRGHAAAAHPTAPEAVAFARRPGTFALVLDCARGTVTHRLDAPEGRHFYGHGAFVRDGRLLVTTENDIATGEGRLGLWDRARGYARVGEAASGGIGPHDILRLRGDVLAVANGGIRTHPERGREKLNLDSMRPNLSYLTLDGGVEETVELPPDLHHASIRHLAQEGETVAFAMQWQGGTAPDVPLLGLHRRGAAPILAIADLAEQMAMDGYAGSVALAGGAAAITSPRGGRIHVFDADGSFRSAHLRRDVCGLAPARTGMCATDGLGGILALDDAGLTPLGATDAAWDNHLIRIAT